MTFFSKMGSRSSHHFPTCSVRSLGLRFPQVLLPEPPPPPTPPEPPDPPDPPSQIRLSSYEFTSQLHCSTFHVSFLSEKAHVQSQPPSPPLSQDLALPHHLKGTDTPLLLLPVEVDAWVASLSQPKSPNMCVLFFPIDYLSCELHIAIKALEVRESCWNFITTSSVPLLCGQVRHMLWFSSIMIRSFGSLAGAYTPLVGNFLAFVRAFTANCSLLPWFTSVNMGLPCIEVFIRFVLTFCVARNLFPFICIIIYGSVQNLFKELSPTSDLCIILSIQLAMNSWDWLGLVQPCVPSSATCSAFPCALTDTLIVVVSSWAGFVRSSSNARFKTGSLLNGQPQFSLVHLPAASLLCSSTVSSCVFSSSDLVTSPSNPFSQVCSCPSLNGSYTVGRNWKGIASVTIDLRKNGDRLQLFSMYLSVRIHLLQVPQYEEDSVFVQSLFRRQSVAHNVPGFDTEMNHQDPSFSLGVLCVVVGMCAGLVFMVVDGCVSKFQPFQPSSQKIVSHREPLNWYFGVSRRMLFLVCGMVWIIKDPFFRPTFVSSTLVAATHALEAATIAALVLGCSRRACSSICQDLMFLHSIGGLADKFEDVLVDTFELWSKFHIAFPLLCISTQEFLFVHLLHKWS